MRRPARDRQSVSSTVVKERPYRQGLAVAGERHRVARVITRASPSISAPICLAWVRTASNTVMVAV